MKHEDFCFPSTRGVVSCKSMLLGHCDKWHPKIKLDGEEFMSRVCILLYSGNNS